MTRGRDLLSRGPTSPCQIVRESWLDVRGLALRWRAVALLGRRVDITSASARLVTLVRRPILSPSHKSKRAPVSIEVDHLGARAELTSAAAFRRGVYDFGWPV